MKSNVFQYWIQLIDNIISFVVRQLGISNKKLQHIWRILVLTSEHG